MDLSLLKNAEFLEGFSWRKCLVWFTVPSFCTSLLNPALLLICGQTNFGILMQFLWGSFLIMGFQVGIGSVFLYLLTLRAGFFRRIIIASVVCAVTLGYLCAAGSQHERYESDREILRPLTPKEELEREAYFWEAFVFFAFYFALLGGGVATLVCWILRLQRKSSNS